MLKKVAFTMFPVKDTPRARAFYEGRLGLRVGGHSDNGVWTEYDLPGGGWPCSIIPIRSRLPLRAARASRSRSKTWTCSSRASRAKA